MVARRLRHGSQAEGGVRRGRLRRHGQFHDHGRRALVRVRDFLPPAPGAPDRLHGRQPPRRRRRHERERLGHEAEPDLQVRRRPHGLCDLLGGLPERRQQPGPPHFDPAAHLQVGHDRQLRDRRQDRVAGPPHPPQRRGLRHGMEGLRGPGRGSAERRLRRERRSDPECVPARLRQPADRRDPGPRDRVHLRRKRRLAGRRDARLQRRRRSRRRRCCTLTDDQRPGVRAAGREGRAAAADAGLDRLARRRVAAARPAAECAAVRAHGPRLRRRSGHEPRGLRVGHRPGRRQSRSTPTRPGDIRFGLEGEHWSGSFFVQNVSDERAVTFRSNRWAVPRLSILQPRTLGLQFRYEF